MKFLILAVFSFCALQAWAKRVEVKIEGMTCGMCEAAITKELNATGKCDKVSVQLKDEKAVFQEKKGPVITDEEIKAAVKKAGYKAVQITRT